MSVRAEELGAAAATLSQASTAVAAVDAGSDGELGTGLLSAALAELATTVQNSATLMAGALDETSANTAAAGDAYIAVDTRSIDTPLH